MHTVRVSFYENMTEKYQFRFPKTKKKRIVKKWGKMPDNLKVRPRKDLAITGIMPDGIIVAVGHPTMKSKLEELNLYGDENSPRF